ncbi:MAG: 4-hydroxy-3-methylbut-2-enyl diphosphate reductase, partial [Armatimonadetes bacterium]|nr:4-hydroxy-3-methylbut-2-enyl diphosphate reductase [Armatimonadota bacterium]
MSLQKIILVQPRGFCAGVVRAVAIVEEALEITKPIYVRKEIVHNKHVVQDLRERGAIFVSELEEVPDGTPGNPIVCIFSAHGVSPAVRARAKEKNLFVIDATCPLVTKVHMEAIRFAKEGYSIILIGHNGHEEVEGTMGEAPFAITLVESVEDVETLVLPNPEKLIYLTQTTLSVDDTAQIVEALKKKFPHMTPPPKEDICYATTNRQHAVKQLVPHCDLILVIGAKNSSNSQRLREVAENSGVRSYLIDDETMIRDEWFEGVKHVGITAGASAPEVLVERVIENLRRRGPAVQTETLTIEEENVYFNLPKN